MTNPSHDLFLLATNVGQIKNPARVISLFVEGINTIFPDLDLRWSENTTPEEPNRVEVCTRNGQFGSLVYRGTAEPDEMTRALIHNASQWLRVILENLHQEQLLLEQKQELEALAEERAQMAEKLEIRVAERTADLAYANQLLNASRLEALNMMTEAVEARGRAEEIAASLQREIAERQRTEEALRASEALLARSQQIAHVGSWRLDVVANHLTWSDEVYRIFGLRPQEFAATFEAFLEFVHPDDRDAVKYAYWGSLRENTDSYEIEHRIVRQNTGEIRYLHERCIHERDDTNAIVGSVGIVQDITERKRAEQELRIKDSSITSAITALALADLQGCLTYVNPAFVALWKLSSEQDALGKSILDFWDTEDSAAVVVSAIQERGSFRGMLTARLSDGSSADVELTASMVADDDGRPICMMGSFNDVTERLRTERLLQARLRLSEYAIAHPVGNLMQRALDEVENFTHSEIGFFHNVDSDQTSLNLQAWSTRTYAACRTSGQGAHYSLDRAGVWADCVRERRPVVHNDYASLPHMVGLPDEHVPVIRELVVPIMRSGHIVAILGVGNKPTDYDDNDVELVYQLADIAWDIVAQKKAESDLRRSEEIIALKDRFISVVSHEFRTPLAVIQTSSDLLTRYGDRLSSEKRQRIFEQIYEQILVLVRLIDDLLSINRTQAGKAEFAPGLVDLDAFCRTVFDQIQFADAMKHRFEFVSHMTRTTALIDSTLFQHILNNLLSNAVKYSPEGSQITLKLEEDRKHALIITVSDQGIGIPEEDQELLFQPFHRARNVGQAKGTGLGLSIVKEYVKLHGGSIEVDSTVGKGSTFTIILPAVT